MTSHSHADYKASTGIRARRDISANARDLPSSPMGDDELLRAAEYLAQAAREGTTLTLTPSLAARIADAILATLSRPGGA